MFTFQVGTVLQLPEKYLLLELSQRNGAALSLESPGLMRPVAEDKSVISLSEVSFRFLN